MPKKRIKLSDYTAEKREKAGLEIETDDGSVFVIDPPELWPDGVQEKARENDLPGIGMALLGEDRWALFLEQGGSGTLLAALVKDELGASPGESSASPS